jgi:hypothetical protein
LWCILLLLEVLPCKLDVDVEHLLGDKIFERHILEAVAVEGHLEGSLGCRLGILIVAADLGVHRFEHRPGYGCEHGISAGAGPAEIEEHLFLLMSGTDGTTDTTKTEVEIRRLTRFGYCLLPALCVA